MATLFNNYWSSFRDELIATSLVLVVAVGGSFFILNRLVAPKKVEFTPTEAASEITKQVLGQQSDQAVETTVTVAPTLKAIIPTPTDNPYTSEVFYGTGGMYQYEGYTFSLNSPRIQFDARETNARKLLVDMVLTNNNISAGLQNSVTATIIKDGVVIVPQAAMSVTETKIVLPGETLNFQAKLSLIEGTDVSIISFKPAGSLPVVEHILRP
jgi:hypothetical protein